MQFGLLAGERIQARNLTLMGIESYVTATRTLESTGMPLHVCAELLAESYCVLKGLQIVNRHSAVRIKNLGTNVGKGHDLAFEARANSPLALTSSFP